MAEAPTAEVLYTVAEAKRRSFLADLFYRLIKEKPLGSAGLAILVILFLTGVFADLLAPFGMNEMVLSARLSPPSIAHILGTDNLGRDLLSRIIFGARISVFVGLGAAILNVFMSLTIGVISGYFGGKVDLVIQRFVDAFMCFPPLFFYLTIMSVLGPGLGQVIFVLGFTFGVRSSRVSRSAVISIRQNVYMEAGKAIGAGTWRMISRHVLPNVMAPILILFTINIGSAILQESTLSFLGFGIPPPAPSWGGMLSGGGRQYMYDAPWMALWPGVALSATVYGVNMFGDAIRDLLDPRLRGGLGRYSGVKRKKPTQ